MKPNRRVVLSVHSSGRVERSRVASVYSCTRFIGVVSGRRKKRQATGKFLKKKKLGSFRPGLVATIARRLTHRSFQPNM